MNDSFLPTKETVLFRLDKMSFADLISLKDLSMGFLDFP
ncbi:hypothetical protein LEP1GSC103_2957 [Leptospira borgpetersenii serovar Javanica str. UI 09931]|uniref:Uncharacterized protein n=3 Tax=Leptospira borgpetersenii TaxID=174 RepID=A0A0S2IR21_LEPBO|nr:hypothetical protein LBBP_01831 [Leptospira borgpetersenii serovar Ballum]EKQ91792.1 hypothetical protein LEP1GSC101_3301 [Leptospira borgpetersenii str. UI 09149]EKR01997.1 hypothetical protein LEP1GSC121_4055 [Leptospira borgpetersenii serovar Castellonis str. 200801910]EMN14278.1 hypothetical protein LEP1GSC055_2399 [Leptospira borgpetersenii str. Brem 307]EMN18470.1 hypothetical protein LEP1GSC056_2267 [Leptospira borgpetersenii str. Brem 328]EMN59081.1 hypothetical protein LEP1GSC090_1